MSVDYIVASLPSLRFGDKAPLTWEKFGDIVASAGFPSALDVIPSDWNDLETQLKNAQAEARGGAKYMRAVRGCSLYWKKRILDCFGEKDVLKRDEMLDRVWWDAADVLTPPSEPLGRGALATYAIRLRVALKRSMISTEKGNASFDRLTAETKFQKAVDRK